MMEFVYGLGVAVALAGVTVSVENARKAHLLNTQQFVTKLERAAQVAEHACEHCNRILVVEDIRLLYADEAGRLHVICDRDECLLAHTRASAHLPAVDYSSRPAAA